VPLEIDRPLRIAHFALGRINREAADGIDKAVYGLTRAQAELGHSVRLFSVSNKPPIPIPGVSIGTYRCMEPSRLLFTPRLRDLLCWRSPLNLPGRLIADLLAWNPHVLHLHGVHIPQNLILAARARRAGIPYCVSIHAMLAPEAQRRHRWLKWAAAGLERPHLERAAFLHALGESDLAGLRLYGARGVCVVAPNGIDLEGYAPTRLDPASTHSLSSPEQQRTFLCLGRLDTDAKGLDLLLQGFAKAGLSRARLLLVGPSWRGSEPALQALARDLGITAAVQFTGAAFGQRKIDLLAGADVFVQTSRWEGISFAVLEAAGLGKPCLLTAVADPGAKLGSAGAAVIVPPTVDGIAAGLRRFADMELEGLAEMGRRARRVAEGEFAWPPAARKIVEAYRTHAVPKAR
jgi:glycosyltransferase involved in cell wall biosynthesis